MITIDLKDVALEAHRRVPENSTRLAVFVHGTGSSRHSPRNNHVAEVLESDGVASLLFDLLTEDEDRSRETRFDIDLLTTRVQGVLDWIADDETLSGLALHLFGSSTGAAAAIRTAAAEDREIRSVVSRGGRPDMAGDALDRLHTPCMLIVGGNDPRVLSLNRDARDRIPGEVDLRVVEGATHLFEEPGALDEVASLASEWIRTH
ncbi:MAG: dienelactone hydrolase family protein [Spirochaetota bacterium]